ncbi:MAG: hypothetical protein WAV20_08950 [Blastocatellia bacterium]
MARNSAAQGDVHSSAWRATVIHEPAALYTGVSASSRVVTLLRRGDAVDISLEITSGGGKWYAVTAVGQTGATGYLSAQFLDVGEPEMAVRWEYQPPPEPAPVSEAESSASEDAAIASKRKIESDIKGFFVSKFGRTLPVSAFGQTRLHNRLGFDHRNGVDVALHPDSVEGRMLLGKLRGFGVPFIAFRHAVPGIATGAHIHVGKPSRRK